MREKERQKKIWVHSEWVLWSASRGGGFSIVRLNDTEFGFNNKPQPIHFHSGQNNVHEEERDAHGEVKVINDRSDEQFHILHLEYAVVLWYQVAETNGGDSAEIEVERVDKRQFHFLSVFFKLKYIANEKRSSDDVTDKDHNPDHNSTKTSSLRLFDFDFADLSWIDGCPADGIQSVHLYFFVVFVSLAESTGQDLRVEAKNEIRQNFAAFQERGEGQGDAEASDEQSDDSAVVRHGSEVAVADGRHQGDGEPETVVQRKIAATDVAHVGAVSVDFDTLSIFYFHEDESWECAESDAD